MVYHFLVSLIKIDDVQAEDCGLLQVDWDEYYAHYVKSLLGLDEGTIQQLKSNPQSVTRQIKVWKTV
jgi:hypothetical protein